MNGSRRRGAAARDEATPTDSAPETPGGGGGESHTEEKKATELDGEDIRALLEELDERLSDHDVVRSTEIPGVS